MDIIKNNVTTDQHQVDQTNIIGFISDEANVSSGINTATDETMTQDIFDEADLNKFLSRTVTIQSGDWTVGTQLATSTYALANWASDATIINKLSNFYRLRFRSLRIQLRINATPQHHGGLMMVFHPYEKLDDSHTFGPGLSTTSDLYTQNLILSSQKLVTYINIKESNVATLEIPFVWPNNHIDLTNLTELENFGTLHIFGLDELRAIGSNTSVISYDVFVNMVDPLLTIPTAQIVLQAPAEVDEYATGPVSKPLSQVSNVLKAASSINIIKPYALAGSAIAEGAGRLASLLGFSKPTVINHPNFIVQNTTSHQANTDMNDPMEKLTLTAKQGVTVDPRVTGCPPVDEMRLETLLGRESCLGWFDYEASDARHSIIFQCDVSPYLGVSVYDGVSNSWSLALTSMAYASLPFQYWCGDLEFRFMILSSRFHTGRIYLSWEPSDGGVGTQITKNYTKVINIGEEQNVTVTIPWGAPQTYKEVPHDRTLTSWNSASQTYTALPDNYRNGKIVMKVMNKLSVGQLTPSDKVRIMVFCKACPNFTLQAPLGSKLRELSVFPVPSNVLYILYSTLFKSRCCNGAHCDCEIVEQGPAEANDKAVTVGEADCCDTMASSETQDVSRKSIVHFGEEIISIKSLLLRSQFFVNENAPLANNGTIGSGQGQLITYLTSNFPRYFGFSTNGNYEVTIGSITNFNPTLMTLLGYFTAGYVCRRGGIRHAYISGYEKGDIISAYRSPIHFLNLGNTGQKYYYKDSIPGHTATEGGYHYCDNLISGGATTSSAVRNSVNVEIPYYSPSRFKYGRNFDIENGTTFDYSNYDFHSVQVDNVYDPNYGGTNYLKHYVSAADDFSLSYYIGAPALFVYDNSYEITGP
jgi:hypothetical protein